MHAAVALLKAMTVAFPPFSGYHHNLTLAVPPKTDVQASSKLCLSLMSRGYASYWLDEDDFKRPIEDLIAEITRMHIEALEYFGKGKI